MLKDLFISEEGGVKQWVVYSAVAVAVLAAGYWAYATWTGGNSRMAATMMCYTKGCNYQRTRPLEVGELIPGKCPKCGKDSVVPAFLCPKCRTPNVWNEDRGLPPPTKCTKCGQEVRHGQ